jgi:hypothetical protein
VIIYAGSSEANKEKDRELNDITDKEDDNTAHIFSGKTQTSTAPEEPALTVKSPADRDSVEKSSKSLKQEQVSSHQPSPSDTLPSDTLATLKTTNLSPLESPSHLAGLDLKSEL